MIMLVPLKCEKYYNNNEMTLVNQRVHTAYKEIFDFAGGNNKNRYEILIAPILTLGKNTIEFARFERNEDNELIIDEETKIPSRSRYIFKEMDSLYTPQFCEQPLLYILAYLLNEMEKMKKKEKRDAGVIKKIRLLFGEKFGSDASEEDFLTQKQIIINQLKKSGDGYEIFNDPLHFR